jgi:type I restriction enzyme, S subunit
VSVGSKGWRKRSIEEIVEILDRKRIPVNAKEREKRKGHIPYYGATGQVGWIDDYIFDEELVLLGEDGAPFFDGSKPVAYIVKGKTWVNNHAHVLRMRNGHLSLFVMHQLNILDYHPYVSGTTRYKLPQGAMKNIELLMPSPEVQFQTVQAIESYLSRIDKAEENLRQVQAKLKQYRASVLKAAVEGKLVPTEAELAREEGREYEPASVLLERILKERKRRWIEDAAEKGRVKAEEKAKKAGEPWTPEDDAEALEAERIKAAKKYKEPIAPETDGLPGLPEGWCWATVDQIASVVRGASPRPAGDPRYFGGTIPWITVGDLTQEDTPFLYGVSKGVTEAGCRASRYILTDTLLLTNSGATLGVPKIIKISGCINDGSVALLYLDYPVKLYIYYFLLTQTEHLRKINQGAAQPNLNTNIVKSIYVPIPPLSEQEKILKKIELLFGSMQKSRKLINNSLKRLINLRQSILKSAFEGKLVEMNEGRTDE